MTSSSSPSKRARTIPPLRTFYRSPALDETAKSLFLRKLHERGITNLRSDDFETETCYYVELKTPDVGAEKLAILKWLIGETFDDAEATSTESRLLANKDRIVMEVGPRLTFATPWSSNASAVLTSCGMNEEVGRMERSKRFSFKKASIGKQDIDKLKELLYDRMTEEIYPKPLTSFSLPAAKADKSGAQIVDLLGSPDPIATLKRMSDELGLSFDDWDLEYYSSLFIKDMKRNPTDVELFDLAQSNSEHSRHWFFGGKMVFDGVEQPKTLFEMVKATIASPEVRANSVIAFRDNSSAIRGFPGVSVLTPQELDENERREAGANRLTRITPRPLPCLLHGTLTAETHNFPTGVAPFPGAETGTGGRIRDVQCVGRGARVVAGTSAYCVGQLNIPDYPLEWEAAEWKYPPNLATPLQIEIEASNGASDYGNKFGEPVISGHTRSFGMRLPDGTRREWIKPIMFTSGVGLMEERHQIKGSPEPGMVIVKVGGPAYRIGMGGGAASSRTDTSASATQLDFDAVQRGDAEMENKMNRVVRACVERGADNPIVSIHDQGAGGNGNVLKEICEPKGGKIYLRRLPIGDETMTARELWTAEYQENNALLIRKENAQWFTEVCARENVPYAFVGEVTDTGRVVVYDGIDETAPTVVDLDLERVLGKMPPKTFRFSRTSKIVKPLTASLEAGITVRARLDRVLRLLSVGSKRFLTNKVDRCVTGLVAQQQCVGPFHTPLADVGVIAQSHEGRTGVATATGEQPIKGLISPAAGARMSACEALTNLCAGSRVSGGLLGVKCRANWMWAAKAAGEGCDMYDACRALSECLIALGVAIDGGKDSLSMSAKVETETVKAPGQVAVSVYAMVDDLARSLVTPEAKPPRGMVGKTDALLYVNASSNARKLGQARLGGSALAHVYGELGDDPADLDDPRAFAAAFEGIQACIGMRSGGGDAYPLVRASHDVSDGGLLVTVLEMAFAGNVSVELDLPFGEVEEEGLTRALFGEELGFVLQVEEADVETVMRVLTKEHQSNCRRVGSVRRKLARGGPEETVIVRLGSRTVLESTTAELRDVWERTSFELERRQCNPIATREEAEGMRGRVDPPHALSFTPAPTRALSSSSSAGGTRPRVAVIREEGSNGDREMCSAFVEAGFEAFDVAMSDLRSGTVKDLNYFRGVVFVGGFSYADVFGSAKGWAASARFNDRVSKALEGFRSRPDTFSLGVCNGCQLMALLGWVPGLDSSKYTERDQPRFLHNTSGRFESRFVSVRIEKGSPAMMFKGMEGSVMGVWVAHGEGKATFPNRKVLDEVVLPQKLAPVRYVDDSGEPTEKYPFNPNGSAQGIAGLCSPDGRHLALMPHPERCFKTFQIPWAPESWRHGKDALTASPWLRMFQNARDWCVE